MALSIIVPQLNHGRMTEECIDSIINNTLVEHEIVIVDNGSRAEEQISDTYKKKVKYIRLEENIQFAGGCNTGAAQAKYPLLCFMNNDILLKSGWDDIVAFMSENPTAGIVGPKLLYPNNTIQHAGVQVLGTNFNGNVFDHRYRHLPSNHPAVNQQREYQCITGACFFITKTDFDAVNGFDTGYHNGYEDNDLCFKVRFNLNKKVIYYPLSEVIHKESITSSKVPYSESPNKTLFFQRWADKIKEDKTKWDRIDNGYRWNAENLAILFWCSGADLDGQPRPDKHRPSWYDKKKNFKSLMNAAQGVDVYVIYDGQESDYTNYIKSQPIKEFTRINVGSGLESIKEVYRKMRSLSDRYDHFYVSEDDYLYLPDAFAVLLQGINKIDGAIYTLYDHPDRYTRTDDITYGQEKLAVTDICHWRTAESTCSSFCVSKEILNANADILTGQLPDRELSRELYRRGVRLWSPLPGRATHLNTLFMTPLIDWGKLNAHIQI